MQIAARRDSAISRPRCHERLHLCEVRKEQVDRRERERERERSARRTSQLQAENDSESAPDDVPSARS